jgi:TP53 regulating kinase and related kinases
MRLAQGAEATIELEKNLVIKTRLEKTYRHPKIDKSLRKSRNKKEAKILQFLHENNFKVPKIVGVGDFDIKMEFIKGDKLRDVFHKNPEKLGTSIGKIVGRLHSLDIVHGDLTTSNMVLCKNEIYLIDFGLSNFSTKVEDKAVDLHLLSQALKSAHYKVKDALAFVTKGYSENYKNSREVIERLEKVEKRGRNKNK